MNIDELERLLKNLRHHIDRETPERLDQAYRDRHNNNAGTDDLEAYIPPAYAGRVAAFQADIEGLTIYANKRILPPAVNQLVLRKGVFDYDNEEDDVLEAIESYIFALGAVQKLQELARAAS